MDTKNLIIIMILFLCFICARGASEYNPDLLIKKHIKIKNRTLSGILIFSKPVKTDESTEQETKKPETEEFKMTVAGLIMHLLNLAVLAVTVYILYIMPEIPTEEFTFIRYTANTLNLKIAINTVMTLMCGEFAFYCINALKQTYKENREKKGMFIFHIAMVVFFIGFGIYVWINAAMAVFELF